MVFRKNYIYFLVLITIAIWLSVFSIDNRLHIIACDVGQGDAILIQKSSTQVLIDGGPTNKVIDCLGRHMPFWDREIELVVLTHPQEDHYGGLINVFRSYKVQLFGEFNRESSSKGYEALKNEVGSRGISTIDLLSGTSMRLGKIYLDIVWPEGNVDSTNVNDDGVVTLLKYGQFKALFTADVENEVSDLLSENTKLENINYLKVNHHGSKNGLSQKLLDKTSPETAVISVAKNNSYGHPHAEILQMLKKSNVKLFSTAEQGDVDYSVYYLE